MKPKEYLKSGDIVKLTNGDKYMYIPDYFGRKAFVNLEGYLDLTSYSDDLVLSDKYPEYSVDYIYRTTSIGLGFRLLNRSLYEELVWKRSTTIKLTMEDIAEKYGVSKVIITNYKD